MPVLFQVPDVSSKVLSFVFSFNRREMSSYSRMTRHVTTRVIPVAFMRPAGAQPVSSRRLLSQSVSAATHPALGPHPRPQRVKAEAVIIKQGDQTGAHTGGCPRSCRELCSDRAQDQPSSLGPLSLSHTTANPGVSRLQPPAPTEFHIQSISMSPAPHRKSTMTGCWVTLSHTVRGRVPSASSACEVRVSLGRGV